MGNFPSLLGGGVPDGFSGCRTTTCLNTVVGASRVMLLVEYIHSNISIFVSVEFHAEHRPVTKLR